MNFISTPGSFPRSSKSTDEGISTVLNDLHPSNIYSPMHSTYGGELTFSRDMQSKNTKFPISFKEFFNDLHLSKTFSPKIYTESGIIISIIDEHSENAKSWI